MPDLSALLEHVGALSSQTFAFLVVIAGFALAGFAIYVVHASRRQERHDGD